MMFYVVFMIVEYENFFNILINIKDNFYSSSGCEIGRQVLDVKCCRCPSRDLKHDEKTSDHPASTTLPTSDDEKRAKV